MKSLQVFSLSIIALLLSGCFKDIEVPPTKYYAIGIYFPNTKTITTDWGTELIVLNSSVINIKNNNVRILAYFTVEEQVDEKTLKVNITGIYDISVPLIYINEDNLDSLKRNDPIDFSLISIAQDYLNLDFKFWVNNKTHDFFFSKNPEDQEDDKIVLKFHHNANKDTGYNIRETIVSVSIAEFKDLFPEKDSVEIVVSYFKDITTSTEVNIWYKLK